MKAWHLAAAAMVALLGTGTGVASAELLVNGGFEDGATGSLSSPIPGWSTWGNSGWHHADAGRTLDAQAMKLWWDDAGMWQDVAITEGTTLSYGVAVLNHTAETASWNFLIRLEFYNSEVGFDPTDRVGQEDMKFLPASQPVDTWVAMQETVVAPAGADVARIVLNLTDWFDGVGGAINFDNATVAVVPEPAGLALLAAAGLLGSGRGRKRV